MSHQKYEIPGFTTQGGVALDLELAYTTHGELASSRDNAIVVLTSYAAQHDEAEALVAVGAKDHFIVAINMFCNGLSSSPSNTPVPFDGPRFPGITVYDNVVCQRKLIDSLGINRVRLVVGYSMGGLQAFEWGCQHAEIVDAILPICGAARVSPHNWLFLDGAKSALTVDQKFSGGDYTDQPTDGLLAFCRVYAGWVFSQQFFREELHKTMGMDSVDDVVAFLQSYFMRRDANDLLGMLWTWQHANISANETFTGDFNAALASISARTIVMPCTTDQYFTVADNALEVSCMPNAELRPIDSPFGHIAGGGVDPIGKTAIDSAILELLA